MENYGTICGVTIGSNCFYADYDEVFDADIVKTVCAAPYVVSHERANWSLGISASQSVERPGATVWLQPRPWPPLSFLPPLFRLPLLRQVQIAYPDVSEAHRIAVVVL